MNQLFDNKITLEKESHTYKLEDNPNINFISATTFIDQFFEKFDALAVAKKLVATNRRYMDMTVEELLAQWRQSADYGTKVHEEIENFILHKTPVEESKSLQGIQWLKSYVVKANFKIFTEVIIYSKEIGISGTIDLLLLNQDTNEYVLMDWKTSKRIDTKSYRNKMGIHSATSDVEDTKFNHYALQLSLYRYLLEKYYGLKVYEHIIVHLKDMECIGLHTPYMEDTIQQMIQTRT